MPLFDRKQIPKDALRTEQLDHLDDLLLRRTRIGLLLREGGKQQMPRIRTLCQDVLAWDDARWQQEEKRYYALWHKHYYLPA